MGLTRKPLLVEDIFNPDKGWAFSAREVPIETGHAHDGNPYFIVNVDGIEILVFQITEWKEGVSSNVSPQRIVAMTTFPGIEITDPKAFLQANNITHGLPLYGVNDEGIPTMETAFPVSDDFPVEIARGQLQVCLGIISEEARDFLKGVGENEKSFDWGTAQEVAKVAGVFLGALLGISKK
ncbi:MAG: hypothetical protein D6748_05235 [Calditrichaeota bacterium]|nr:MAG: hypothetical protein D6748_05235 [Calditrichota bacterium]